MDTKYSVCSQYSSSWEGAQVSRAARLSDLEAWTLRLVSLSAGMNKL